MAPVINQINTTAIQPYSAGKLAGTEMITTAGAPLHAFMVKQTRIKDVTMFAGMAKSGPYKSSADIPFSVLLPAFVTSELKTAFQIGFLIFLPFIVIDLVVATVLMSLGMMMLQPADHLAPVQAAAVRPRRRLGADDGQPRQQFRELAPMDADYFLTIANQAMWVLALAVGADPDARRCCRG